MVSELLHFVWSRGKTKPDLTGERGYKYLAMGSLQSLRPFAATTALAVAGMIPGMPHPPTPLKGSLVEEGPVVLRTLRVKPVLPPGN